MSDRNMQRTKKSKKRPESDKQEQKAPERSQAEIEEAIRLRVAKEEKAFRMVERFLDNPVTESELKNAAAFIEPRHYDDVTDERSIDMCCGYPLCDNTLTNVPKQKYHISLKSHKVYDITERKKFCSAGCFHASTFYLSQLSSTPVWLRDNSSPPPTISLQDHCQTSPVVKDHQHGPLIDQMSAPSSSPEDPDTENTDQRATEESSYLGEELEQEIHGRGESVVVQSLVEEMRRQEKSNEGLNPQSERPGPPACEGIETCHSEESVAKSEGSGFRSEGSGSKSEGNGSHSEGSVSKIEESGSKSEGTVTKSEESGSHSEESWSHPECSLTPLASDSVFLPLDDGDPQSNDEKPLPIHAVNGSSSGEIHNRRITAFLEKKVREGRQALLGPNTPPVLVHGSAGTHETVNSLTSRGGSVEKVTSVQWSQDEALRNYGLDSDDELPEAEQQQKFGSVNGGQLLCNVETHGEDVSGKIVENGHSRKFFKTEATEVVTQSQSMVTEGKDALGVCTGKIVGSRQPREIVQHVRSKTAVLSELLDRRDYLNKRLAASSDSTPEVPMFNDGTVECGKEGSHLSGVSQRNNATVNKSVASQAEVDLRKIRRLSSSDLPDTTCVTPEKGHRSKTSLQKFSAMDVIKGSLYQWKTAEVVQFFVGGNQGLTGEQFGKKYDKLCREFDAGQRNITGIVDGEDEDFEKKPLPDYMQLQKDSDDYTVQVRQFYNVKASESDNKEVCEVCDVVQNTDYVVLPPVDSHSQYALRRKIVLDKLNKTISGIVSPLHLTMTSVSRDLTRLVSTLRLERDNISWRPPHWLIISYIILTLLAHRNPELHATFTRPYAAHYLRTLALSIGLNDTDINKVIAHMTSV